MKKLESLLILLFYSTSFSTPNIVDPFSLPPPPSTATVYLPLHYISANYADSLLHQSEHALLTTKGNVIIDKNSNLLAIIDEKSAIEKVKCFLKHVDIPPPEVFIKAKIAFIDHQHERELGINFSTSSSGGLASRGGLKMDFSNSIPTPSPLLAVLKLADDQLLELSLAALENSGYAHIISSPSILTLSGQTATISAGEEIPYQQNTGNLSTSIAFQQANLSLAINPLVLPDHNLILHIAVHQDKPTEHAIQGVPTISTRHIHTQVMLHSGQTLVLGGIYENSEEKSLHKIPLLSDLPILGKLFTNKHVAESHQSLMIFVTPEIKYP